MSANLTNPGSHRQTGNRDGAKSFFSPSPALLVSLLPLLFLAVFFFYPLLSILNASFAPQGRLDLSGVKELVTDAYYARVLGFTFAQAAASTLITLLAALPAAYIFARYRFPGENYLRALTTVPFLMPAVVVAAAFTALLGPRGCVNLALMSLLHLESPPLELMNTVAIILIAHIFYNFTVVLRLVGGFWSNLDPQFTNAARVLGANRWRAFSRVTLPLLAPSLMAAALLVFIFDFTSFGVVLLLGGARLATLEVEIYRQTVNLFNLPLAAALSLLQIIFTLMLTLIYSRLQGKLARPLRLSPHALVKRRAHGVGEKTLLFAILASMLLFLGAPLVALVVESFRTASGFATSNYANLFLNPRGSITFVPPIEAVRNSLGFAAVVTLLAVGLGLSAAYSLSQARAQAGGRFSSLRASTFNALYMLPLGTSAVTLGFGFIIALDRPPLDLRATIWLVPIAHALVAFPFVVRSVLPILQSIKPNLREAASVLGANRGSVWREIDLPIIARAVFVGAVFAFVISLGEFGATALIALPDYPTLPLAIYRLLGQPGISNLGQAMALGVILMTVSTVSILLLERFRIGDVGEF
ncbi:MAG TPA: iron ABC transporter permease [Anaerolineae bacterium]